MQLNEFEREVLYKLLSGEHPVLSRLRQQLGTCLVKNRELTGVGFFTDLNCAASPTPGHALDATFGDVIAAIEGLQHGAGFLLYVERGLLTTLEGYSFGEPWPDPISRFRLQYFDGEERNWSELGRNLNLESV